MGLKIPFVLNQDIVAENYLAIDIDTIVTNTSIDNIRSYEFADIVAFTEAVITKERECKVGKFFTVDYDREEELPILFRQSYADYCTSSQDYSYNEFLEEWLEEYNTAIQKQRVEAKKPTKFIEVCPCCSNEIDITLPGNSKEIPFCPYCGQPHVFLCSECHEITNCNSEDPRAFCYGKEGRE